MVLVSETEIETEMFNRVFEAKSGYTRLISKNRLEYHPNRFFQLIF